MSCLERMLRKQETWGSGKGRGEGVALVAPQPVLPGAGAQQGLPRGLFHWKLAAQDMLMGSPQGEGRVSTACDVCFEMYMPFQLLKYFFINELS